jgi:hypothetical protein
VCENTLLAAPSGCSTKKCCSPLLAAIYGIDAKKCDGTTKFNFEEAIAEATVCTFVRLFAAAAYYGQTESDTYTAGADLLTAACSASVAMSGYPNVRAEPSCPCMCHVQLLQSGCLMPQYMTAWSILLV